MFCICYYIIDMFLCVRNWTLRVLDGKSINTMSIVIRVVQS